MGSIVALLHLYIVLRHGDVDRPLTATQLEPLLRVSAPESLDVPAVYAKASEHLNEIFPNHLSSISSSDANADTHELEPALELAMRYKVGSEVYCISPLSLSLNPVLITCVDEENAPLPRRDIHRIRPNGRTRPLWPLTYTHSF